MKILVSDKMSEATMEHLRSFPDFSIDYRIGLNPEELRDIIPQFDGLIVRSATQVDCALIEQAAQLKVVGRAGTGVDNIDVQACTEKGIVVVNTPGANSLAAAELTVALAFDIMRHVSQASCAARSGDFRRGRFVGNELNGKTCGIIGMGKIGMLVAERLQSLGMSVIVYDPYVSPEQVRRLNYTFFDDLHEFLKQVDLLTLHVPKTDQTDAMIGAAELALCKDGVFILNVARGGIVDEDALLAALNSGKVAAAALDVLVKEPNYNLKPESQTFSHPLIDHPNCIYLPHLGASTHEANERVGTMVCNYVIRALNGEFVPAINLPRVQLDESSDLIPMLKLVEKLASIYYQCEDSRVLEVRAHYCGTVFQGAEEILNLSLMKGFLYGCSYRTVSYVNVMSLFQDLGVTLTSEVINCNENQPSNKDGFIRLDFVTDQRTLSVEGTLYAGDQALLTDFFGYPVNFLMMNHMIALQNESVPGIIGRVGTILGEHHVNINAMYWGNKKETHRAQAFVATDAPVSQHVIDELLQIEHVMRVSQMIFT